MRDRLTQHHLAMAVNLKQGEFFIGQNHGVVTTILGSCVALTIYHAPTRTGMMCHGMLPTCRAEHLVEQDHCRGWDANCFRYVDCVVAHMLTECADRGLPYRELQLKLFGGSDMLIHGRSFHKSRFSVGKANVESALKILSTVELQPMRVDTGGHRGRKIVFFLESGEVWRQWLLSKREVCLLGDPFAPKPSSV
ncbi:MAG: chemotaxis protein CheD [Magnetococcales bacterium]|nr:chemotaxis protein CheD [Magnetococcales bacterium]MBF0307980.1 chemotaxis protein CheD [Magnetococcales bacterium]